MWPWPYFLPAQWLHFLNKLGETLVPLILQGRLNELIHMKCLEHMSGLSKWEPLWLSWHMLDDLVTMFSKQSFKQSLTNKSECRGWSGWQARISDSLLAPERDHHISIALIGAFLPLVTHSMHSLCKLQKSIWIITWTVFSFTVTSKSLSSLVCW